MTIEIVHHDGEPTIPFIKKLNPAWWLVGDEGWAVPAINNGQPYLPEVSNIWLRRFYWFFCRNPLMNFVGYVMGVGDRAYKAEGPPPVMATTGRDASPRVLGWRWATLVPDKVSWPAFGVSGLWAALTGILSWWFVVPWLFALLKFAGPLPYVSYFGQVGGRWVEFYFGWRPYSGGFGFKLVFPKEP